MLPHHQKHQTGNSTSSGQQRHGRASSTAPGTRGGANIHTDPTSVLPLACPGLPWAALVGNPSTISYSVAVNSSAHYLYRPPNPRPSATSPYGKMPGLQIVAAAAAHPAAASRERQGSPSERDSSYEGGGIGLAGRYLLTSLRTTNSHSHSNALSCPGIAPLNATSPTTSTTTLSSSPSSNNNNNIISTVDAPWHSLEIASSSSSSTSCTGGESPRSTRDPDLRRSSSVPPPLSLPSSPVSIATSASSELFHEGLTRLDSFVDLARLHQEYASAFDSNSLETGNFCDHENALFPEDWQTIPKGQDEHLGYLPTGTNAGLTVSEAPTATAAHSHSTFYSEPSPTTFYTKDSDSPSYATSFFDPTPSSAGASPRTPYDFTYSRQPSDLMAPRRLVTPEPTEPATYWTSAAGPPQQQQPYQPTMKSSQWRPRSAPKVTDSRSASPLVFWNRRGAASGLSHRQPQDDREEFDATWPRVGTARGYDDSTRDDGDNMLVDTVSNHLGRLTPPSPSNSVGNRSMDSRRKDRDLRISTQEAPKSNRDNDFCQGPPPMITKAEYSALPLAIQRKVRTVKAFTHSLFLTGCAFPNCHFWKLFRCVKMTRNLDSVFFFFSVFVHVWKLFPLFGRDWHPFSLHTRPYPACSPSVLFGSRTKSASLGFR